MSDLELQEAPDQMPDAQADWSVGTKMSDPPTRQDSRNAIPGVRIGMLVGLKEQGSVPLVVFPGQRGGAAVPARACLDLHGAHIGRDVVLMFENGDPQLPIVIACLRRNEASPFPPLPGQLEVDADGERLLVTANEQLVLRCGKASITLTKSGKVLIQGAYVSNSSSGVNRIKGGSVQIN